MDTKKTILVIEDEKDLAEVLKVKLEDAGFATHVAFDGESGLKIAVAEHPDLILLDIVLPGMNGVEMLKQLRKDEWGKNALVMILTNSDDVETMSQVIENGAYEYFVKTEWKIEDIISKIKDKLNADQNRAVWKVERKF